jgi:hypothetical protein
MGRSVAVTNYVPYEDSVLTPLAVEGFVQYAG